MQKNKNCKKILILLSFLVVCVNIFFTSFWLTKIYASTDCNQLSGSDKSKCEDLEKKAQAYKDLIDIKNKQENTLQKQMQSIDVEQAKNQDAYQKTKNDIATYADKISSLEDEIKYKENLINYEKALLSNLLQSYYEDYQSGILRIVLAGDSFADIFGQTDRIKQISTKADDLLRDIKQNKEDLTAEHADVQDRKAKSEDLKGDLEDKKNDLLATETQKQALLTQTQGEQAKYAKLLARVESQKAELMNFGSTDNLASVKASVDKYDKPSDNLASTSWYFNQTDSRWGDKTIGNSNSKISDYGCAISSVAMVFRYYGANINPGTLAKQKIFYYDLIQWPTSWSSGIKLSSSISHGNINWKTIDSEIKDDNPVIVYIGKTSGSGGHYVVITGKDDKDYIVHDPYFGANLYLGTSRALVGALGKNSGTKIDQMIIYGK